MEILLLIGVCIAGFFVLPSILADKKTKLFRRVWSTEVGRASEHNIEQQSIAIDRLLEIYGVKNNDSPQKKRDGLSSLMADAVTFDLKHTRNRGIEVTAIISRSIRIRFRDLNSD